VVLGLAESFASAYLQTEYKDVVAFALLILVLLPLQMLSGSSTPRESMPAFVQDIMIAAPTTHFVAAAQAILYRGAGLDFVWQPMAWLVAIGSTFFAFSLRRFSRTVGQMA
jgi:ABC-2 type transport system permease protein